MHDNPCALEDWYRLRLVRALHKLQVRGASASAVQLTAPWSMSHGCCSPWTLFA